VTEFPRVIRRQATVVSPWVTLVEKEVQLTADAPPEVYHSLTQPDYVAALAMTRDGRIPLIRQYRPAVEAYTWEFPAGTVDDGETPAQAMTRELVEETGLHAEALHEIGSYHPDTGRLSLTSTGFFARCADAGPDLPLEPHLEVRFVTLRQLLELVDSGGFRHQLHVALLASAAVRGHITLPDRRYDGRGSHGLP
jgi:ADP-ribose pyrophosphatase